MLRKFVTGSTGRLPVFILVLGWLCLISSVLAGGDRLLKVDTSKKNVIPNETAPPLQLYTAGNLVVKLYAADSVSIDQVNTQFGTTVDKYLANLRLYLLTIPDGADPDELAAQISLSPWVAYAQPNYVTDPLNPVQGSYPFPDLTHEGDFDGQEAAAQLQLTSVHQETTGSGVTVGVLDGGVDYTHPQFNGRVVSGWDYVDDDADAMDEPGGDNSGHGTFVAGVVALVAPDATIRAYRVSDVDGRSEGYLLAEAIMQAVDDGCDIINLSLAMTHPHAAVSDALQFAVDNDVLVVAAAGNGGVEEVRYPASDINALAVAAIDSLGLLAEFSNYGPEVDVCAPGAWIYSPFQNDGYAWWDGTSFASPFVAGQAALLRSRNPLASVGQLRSAIMVSADDLDATNPAYSGKLGKGLIDPLAAVNLFSGTDSAQVWPDTISVAVPLGTMDTILVAAVVTSSNAPANFTAEVVNTGDRFIQLMQSTGTTNDSIYIAVFPGWPFSGGLWYNTVSIQVEGTNAPVDLVIKLDLTPGQGGESAWITPNFINVTIPQGWLGMLSNVITVNSSNAPAFYSVNGGDFTIVVDSSGLTGDSAYVHIDPTGLPIGTHCDSLLFNVVGVTDPAPLVVCLTITPDSGGYQSAWTTPASLSFTLPLGSATAAGCVVVSSTNAPAGFTIQHNPAGFVSVPQPTGTTNDSACVIVDPAVYAPGSYCDSILIFVDGISGPVSLPVCMTITGNSGGGDSAWTSPSSFSFVVPEGGDSVAGCFWIHSSNEPAAYTSWYDTNSFLFLTNPTGPTGSNPCVLAFPSGYGPGSYCDTIFFLVDGVLDTVKLPICMTVTDTIPSGDTMWVMPPMVAVEVIEGAADSIVGCLTVGSTNAPAAIYGDVLRQYLPPDFQMINTIDTTPGNLCYMINPAGLGVGTYCDTILVSVEGIPGAKIVPVCVTVVPDSGTGYPPIIAMPSQIGVTLSENAPGLGRCLLITSTNMPRDFALSLSSNGAPTFVSYADSLGITDDTVCLFIDPAGYAPGSYCDSLLIWATGVWSPVSVPVCMTIVPDTSGGGGGADSSWAIPGGLSFVEPFGADTAIQCFGIFSSNEPANFYITDDSNSIFLVTSPNGLTGQGSCVIADPTGLAPGTYCDTLRIYVEGVSGLLGVPICLTVTSGDTLPAFSVSLDGNYPNPFNPETNISFSLPQAMDVQLVVYNVLGQKIATLVDREMIAGTHIVTWNGTSETGQPVASGIYFYRLTTSTAVETRKMLLLK